MIHVSVEAGRSTKNAVEKISKKSIESLHHFQCFHCERWWTIGDAPNDKDYFYCPWCGKENKFKKVMENKERVSKKIVISASASQTEAIEKWIKYWGGEGCEIANYPIGISEEDFVDIYPKVHKDFYRSLFECDIHFIANEDKNGIVGYIGAGVFAELSFSLGLNFSRDKKIDICILKIPDTKSFFCEDIKRWVDLGWVKLFKIDERN